MRTVIEGGSKRLLIDPETAEYVKKGNPEVLLALACEAALAGLWAEAEAWSKVATAAASFMPVETVLEAQTVDDATQRLNEVEAILEDARQHARRHPAIISALETIREGRPE